MPTKNHLLLLFFCCVTSYSFAQTNKTKDSTNHTPTAADTLAARNHSDTLKKHKVVSFGPASFDFNLDKGKSGKQNFYIINRKDKAYQVNLTVKDFMRDSVGNILFYDAGTTKNSAANWITLDKTYLEVPPGKIGTVVVTVNVPDSVNTDQMKWAMIVADVPSENLPPHKSGNITTILENKIKVGSHVYVNFPGLSKELKMLSFKPNTDSTYQIAIKNVGGAQIRCNVSIEVASQLTGEKKTFTEEDVPLFPEQIRLLQFKLPKGSFPVGKYTLVALADALDDDVPLEAAQLEVELK
ncbi:MAG: hypothetical protein BGO70_12540 [Bacteroidetes bacterium 43-93]|nr:hypothetical protein [Bacteroidota bacterium]OJW98282.1 MAG: hypothetical protein BGO70_12540 [Bacteroidetes bacterium 43-93]